MTRYRALVPALVLLAGAVMALAQPGNTAASKSSGAGLAVGYVDIEEVTEKSAVGQAAKNEARELTSKLQGELERKEQVAMLTATQRDELVKLEAKSNPSDADKAKIAELKGMSRKLLDELQNLQQKPSASEAEKARLQELTQRWTTARTELIKEKDTAEGQLRERAAQLMVKIQDQVLKAVEAEAKARGLAMVVHKEARLFGGEDITGGVINRLKK